MKTILISVMAALTLAGCTAETATEQTQAQQMIEPTAAAAASKQLVTDFFQHFSAGDIDTAFAMVSDDGTWWVPGDLPFSGTKSKAEYLQVIGAIQTGFPDGLELKITSMIAEGNTVAAEVASNGDHVNGRKYTNKYHFLITIENGKIAMVKEYMDTLHLYRLIQP